jgi:lysophospholipase L1-like esterase
MKKLIMVILVSLLTACGGGGGGGSGGGMPMMPGIPTTPVTPVTPPAAPVCSVALFGDSIMHGGYQLTLRLPIPPAANVKIQRPKYEVKDYSYNGASAAQSLPSFLSQEITSEVVVIEYGVNDAGNGLLYEIPMRSMLDRAKALNKKIIITGILKSAAGLPRYNEYNEVAKALAKEYGATWAGWDEVAFDASKDAPDGLHPSQEYSTRLVGALATALDIVSPDCK